MKRCKRHSGARDEWCRVNTLAAFQARLEMAIGKPATLRPFVCEGSPLDCGVFIVGFNPATEMSADFWKFWTPGYGFNKAAWFDAYKAERLNKPLRPGKARRNAVSPTRRAIDWICESASPLRCLETNIYATASLDMNSLGHEDRDAATFMFLVETIKPSVIVAHGKTLAERQNAFRITRRFWQCLISHAGGLKRRPANSVRSLGCWRQRRRARTDR